MKTLFFILTVVFAPLTFADYEGYDEIVDKLSRYQTTEVRKDISSARTSRSFSRAHIGLGLTQTFFDADAPNLNSGMQNQGGLIINVGVDVLSSLWGVEGSYANFGNRSTDDNQINLREFSLIGLYKPALNKNWNMRMGVGVSSRFLKINNLVASSEYRTPSGIFLFGMDTYLNSFISVGADFKFKTAMIHETIDKNSVDLAFRVDTHF